MRTLLQMDASPQEQLTFEQSLERLEALVAAMERGDVPLAELLSKFEEADKLLRRCQGCLTDAELKIERLRKDRDGISLEPFQEGVSDSNE